MFQPSSAATLATQPPRKWKRRLGLGLGLALLILWLLPTLVAHTPVLGWILGKAAKDLHGTLSADGASLGWFSPVVLRDVAVRDAAGKPLLRIPKVESEGTLLGMLLHRAGPARFHCDKAALDVVFTKDATNLEMALAKYLVARTEDGHGAPAVAANKAASRSALVLDFQEAKVTVHDRETKRHWVLDPVTINLGLNQEGAPPLQLEVHAALPGVSPGFLQTQLTFDGSGDGKIELKGRMDNIPLALAAPVLRRFQPGNRFEGNVKGHWDLSWSKSSGSFEGELSAHDFLAAGPLVAAETVRLTQVTMPWKLTRTGNRLTIETAALDCDVGHLSFQGSIDTDRGTLLQSGSVRVKGGAWRVEGRDTSLSLDIDLARLAEIMPATLRLHKDTKLVAGRLTMDCKDVALTPGAMVWQGKVNATELRGIREGKNIAWPDPLALSFKIGQTANALPNIEQLRCESAFLKLDADGSADQFTVIASVDLPKLVEPLGLFFDLSQMRLEGQAGGQVTILHKVPGYFQIAGAGFLRSFHWELTKGRPWSEESCTVTFQGDGRNLPGEKQQIDNGYVRIQSGTDILEAQIREPVANLVDGPWGNIQLKLEGDLARWQARAQPWTNALDAWQMGGTVAGKIDVQASTSRLGFGGDMTVTNMVIGSPDQPCWQDAEVKLTTHGTANWATDVCEFDKVRVESRLLTCAAKGRMTKLSTSKEIDITGHLMYDLENLEPYLRPYLSGKLQASGKETRPFALTGPLAAKAPQPGIALTMASPYSLMALQGDAGLRWKAIKAYGCDVGPGEVGAKLNAGWLKLSTLESTLNGGRIRLEARLRLEPGPMVLHLAPGPMVDRACITSEMCSAALGYAIPALAGATVADGLVSLTLEGGHLNLADQTKSELKGTLRLHSARIDTGPLVRELNGLLRSPSPANLVKETRVPFQVINGRVYHQNLELAFPNFTIRTSGSVGMDGTVALVAEMPIPPRWLGNNALAAALANQTIRLPIGGTIDNPHIDPQALQAANAQFIRNAASDVIRNDLEGNLRKLFGR
jgi:hypothetical protein